MYTGGAQCTAKFVYSDGAGNDGLGNLAKELGYAQAHSGIAGLRLVRGTEDFTTLLP